MRTVLHVRRCVSLAFRQHSVTEFPEPNKTESNKICLVLSFQTTLSATNEIANRWYSDLLLRYRDL